MISCGPIVVPNLFHVLPLVKQPIGGEGGGVKAMVENGIVDNVRRESPCQIPPLLFHEHNQDKENGD